MGWWIGRLTDMVNKNSGCVVCTTRCPASSPRASRPMQDCRVEDTPRLLICKSVHQYTNLLVHVGPRSGPDDPFDRYLANGVDGNKAELRRPEPALRHLTRTEIIAARYTPSFGPLDWSLFFSYTMLTAQQEHTAKACCP